MALAIELRCDDGNDDDDDDNEEDIDKVVDNNWGNTCSINNIYCCQAILLCELQNIETYMTYTEDGKQSFWRKHI